MDIWGWVLAGLTAWFAVAVVLGLWLGPVLGRWSQARDAVDPYSEMPAELKQSPRQWQRAS